MSNRIEKRNVRVPELLDDLSLAQGNEKTKLEKELSIIIITILNLNKQAWHSTAKNY